MVFRTQFQLEWEGEKYARWKFYNSWSVAAEKHRLNLNWARRFFFRFFRLISSLFVDTLLTSSPRYRAMNSINFPKIKWDFRLLFVICCLAGMVNGFGARFGGWRNCLNLKFIDGERRRCRSWRWSVRENSKKTFFHDWIFFQSFIRWKTTLVFLRVLSENLIEKVASGVRKYQSTNEMTKINLFPIETRINIAIRAEDFVIGIVVWRTNPRPSSQQQNTM